MNPEAFQDQTTEYLEWSFFAEKVNELQPPITFEKSSILDVSEYVLNTEYCSEYASGSVNYFRKKLHLRCLTGF